MLRGLALELRAHMPGTVWAELWDGAFFVGSALLAVFYGVALGNVVRGVPLDAQGNFFEPLWTDFNPTSATPGVLDWYTILVGSLALPALVLHGSHYVAVKTEGILNARCRRMARGALWVTVVLTVLTTFATFAIRLPLLVSFALARGASSLAAGDWWSRQRLVFTPPGTRPAKLDRLRCLSGRHAHECGVHRLPGVAARRRPRQQPDSVQLGRAALRTHCRTGLVGDWHGARGRVFRPDLPDVPWEGAARRRKPRLLS